MSVAAPLRIGVVGVGRIGARHAVTLSGLDGVSLVLADADRLRAAEVAGRSNCGVIPIEIESANSMDSMTERPRAMFATRMVSARTAVIRTRKTE
jgi:predicted dehydrogenase